MVNAVDRMRKVLTKQQQEQNRTFEQLPAVDLFCGKGELYLYNCVLRQLPFDRIRVAAMAFMDFNSILHDQLALKENRLRLCAFVIRYVDAIKKDKPDGRKNSGSPRNGNSAIGSQ